MTHDSARLSALVDGELDHEARERVLAHITQCDDCRATVEAERKVRSLLGGLANAPEAKPSEDFLQNLVRLGNTDQPGSTRSEWDEQPVAARPRVVAAHRRSATRPTRRPATSLVGSGRPAAAPFSGLAPAAGLPAGGGLSAAAALAPTSFGRQRRRVVAGVAGAASAFGMTAVLAFALGGSDTPPPTVDVVPPVKQFSVEHAETTSNSPLWDAGSVTNLFDQPSNGQGVGGR